MLTNTAIQGYKEYTKADIAYAKYKVGNTYYQVPIQDRGYLADGRLYVRIMIDHTVPGRITITEIQLFDTNNNLWLTKPESIIREDVTAGILYRFTFDFHEN
jgi:hypothetical protein